MSTNQKYCQKDSIDLQQLKYLDLISRSKSLCITKELSLESCFLHHYLEIYIKSQSQLKIEVKWSNLQYSNNLPECPKLGQIDVFHLFHVPLDLSLDVGVQIKWGERQLFYWKKESFFKCILNIKFRGMRVSHLSWLPLLGFFTSIMKPAKCAFPFLVILLQFTLCFKLVG